MSSPIAVFGSINMDLVIYSNHKPNEGETIFGNSFETFQGGKGANQAVAASRLGSDVSFIGKVGNDVFGKQLQENLISESVNVEMLYSHEGESGVAFINVFEDIVENQIIVVSGANAFVESRQVSKESLNHIDILLSQLEVPPEQIEDLFIRAKGSCFRILNTAPAVTISEELIKNTDLLVMNETELETLSGETLESQNIDSIISSIKGLSLKNHQSIVITLGSQGVYVCQDQKGELINGHEVHAMDTTGSGDCFIGALASNYLETENLYEAALFGNKAAALSTTKKGASLSMPTQDEVENWFQTF